MHVSQRSSDSLADVRSQPVYHLIAGRKRKRHGASVEKPSHLKRLAESKQAERVRWGQMMKIPSLSNSLAHEAACNVVALTHAGRGTAGEG